MSTDGKLVEQYLFLIQNAARTATLLTVGQAQEVVSEIERTSAFLPFFDPTRYMEIQDKIPDHAKLARAFLAFRKTIQEITGQ